jgi:hypothetical protein
MSYVAVSAAGVVAAGAALAGAAGVACLGEAPTGAAGVGVGVGSATGVFSCSGGVWVGDDRERHGTGTCPGVVSVVPIDNWDNRIP